jgi:hypothetical protein
VQQSDKSQFEFSENYAIMTSERGKGAIPCGFGRFIWKYPIYAT